MASNAVRLSLLRTRLLRDIADLHENPEPGISLHTQDVNSLESACLVLTPQVIDGKPLHLTIHFGPDYPLGAPEVVMDSTGVRHPNVFDGYICASILNTNEGYTPAYTLKGICIQLLSFFSSDKIKQMDSGRSVDREEHVRQSRGGAIRIGWNEDDSFPCARCEYGKAAEMDGSPVKTTKPIMSVFETTRLRVNGPMAVAHLSLYKGESGKADGLADPAVPVAGQTTHLVDLPEDILLIVLAELNDEGLALAARAWNGFSRLIYQHNIVTIREMRCFTLKTSFKDSFLGIGVNVVRRSIQSDFDLLSFEAFGILGVRKSVHGAGFQYWLPLPLSEQHWERVKRRSMHVLNAVYHQIEVQGPAGITLFTFMNDVVVNLSQAASEVEKTRNLRWSSASGIYNGTKISTLTHASEKAIESYFQLYHLLACLAIERPEVAIEANALVSRFLGGERDKKACPNLGHLLVALLISDVVAQTDGSDDRKTKSEELTEAIVKEAVTRNVVWMLDDKGAGMAELSYMEPSAVSDYRLQKTFDASKTS
ncbi:hypothetical protein B0A50_00040 [Salinomyces thailandicus]|uniref:UBC core domain-containing protein n=1 Tax=Salinomyces thailandicus TaxID=706561 RepID=A0A4U0UEU3_9PEZI|nr:hypothetical protein B0A50_00040 [Salinomyces thailandica]